MNERLVGQVVRAQRDASEVGAVGGGGSWADGTTTSGEVIRPVQRLQQFSYYPQLTDRIRELADQGRGASGIADRLEAEGFCPAMGGRRISAATVRDLMRRLACRTGRVHQHRPAPPGEEPGPNEWWLKHLAAELDMTTSTLYAWINRGWITTRRESCWPHRLSPTPTSENSPNSANAAPVRQAGTAGECSMIGGSDDQGDAR